MTIVLTLLFVFSFGHYSAFQEAQPSPQPARVETTYDSSRDETTVKLARIQIAGSSGIYRGLYMSPYFAYPGKEFRKPEIVHFELNSVVAASRLRTDLYVLFVIDGEKIFLSSSRSAVRRPVPGRVWVGERLVFRMPYETFEKITNAKSFEIKFDAVSFPVAENERQTLRDFLTYMRPRP